MTTDITELAQSLKAAAEKASGGDWVKESGDGWDATCSNDDQANSGFIIAHFVGPDSAANREFVQLANPANIRALVEALEKAQRYIERLREWNAGLAQESCEREQRIFELENQLKSAENNEIDARCHIAELESRTVTVKMPKLKMLEDYLAEVAIEERKQILVGVKLEFHRACVAAGIKVEAE
ncbi:ead/Ea22-like family protein [Raoultella terrigena]|uniref:ead/Ea22-like family protein n=1 Tax=Raoultella terrigena TaxID=577 RepID=UPI0030E3AFE8